jgi:hypothetical protein
MTSEDVKSEIERVPFKPLRLHLASGKVIDIQHSGQPFMLQNAIMVMTGRDLDSYDIVSLRNIERLERLEHRP